jgi:predicted DNA binding CopG/RHH family protein
MLSEFMARDIGGKEGRFMKSKIKYTEEPMGELKNIKDFLPPPEQLVLKEENVKVTLALKKSSVDFFKKQAKKHHTSYQKMIRQVIDWYTSHYQKSVNKPLLRTADRRH